MDPLLGPARPEPEPVSGCSDLPGTTTTTVSGTSSQPGEGSAQTILDAWLQQLQTDQTEEPVVESRLDIDSLFSSELEFDLDFLTELSSLRGSGSGDGGVTLQELSQDLELGLFCPPGAPLEPDPLDLGSLSGAELFCEQPPPASTQPEATSVRPGPAAASEPTAAAASERPGSGAGSAPPRPPPVASISVVTNKQRQKTVVTISTPRGRQSFVLPTADLTQASRVLRALQQKRRQSRATAAAAAVKTEMEDAKKEEEEKEEGTVESPAASSRQRSAEAPHKRKKSQSDSKDDDDRVMSEALRHLGVDLTQLEMDRHTKAVTCPEPGCDMKTSNAFKLKVHILQHWNYKPYKCSEEGCKWEFFERGKLNRHEATHTRASLKCGEPGCPAAFRTRTNLQRHRLLLHGLSSPAPPPPQTEPAAPPTDGAADEAQPPTPAQFRCTHCDRAFKMAAGLKRHLSWHEKQMVSVCPYPGCGFTASGTQQLKLHERRHADKQFRCTFPECSWAFASHAKLKRHLAQHTGRRNFRCPYSGCDKSYRRMEYLSGHIRLHLGRYFQCPQKGCWLQFTHQFSLATHIRSAHDVPSIDPADPDTASLTCPMCDARFKSDIYRQIHLQDVHGTSSSKQLQSPSAARDDDEECDARRRKSKFNPESLNWVEDGEPIRVDDGQTCTVYVPFDVETDSGPSEVLVKCDVTEEECRRLGIEWGPESAAGAEPEPPLAYDHVLDENNSAKDTARELRRMGIGVLPAGLRRTAHSGCARTDITSCHLAVRRARPRPRRPPAGRQRRPGGWPRKHAERPGAVAAAPSPYDPGLLMDPLQAGQVALEPPPSLLCDSDLLGSVHDQLQHSTINLSDLT